MPAPGIKEANRRNFIAVWRKPKRFLKGRLQPVMTFITDTTDFLPQPQTMTRTQNRRRALSALVAFFVVAPAVLLPLAAPTPAHAQLGGVVNKVKNMSTGKKVVALAGAALLYYLYKKHNAKVAEEKAVAAERNTPNLPANRGNQVASRGPQLYQSKNGGIYYRNAQGKAIWVTAPKRTMQVSQEELAQYAPDYQQYQNRRVPSAPRGYQTQTIDNLDPGLMNNYGTASAPGRSTMAPGPRGR